MRDLLAIGCGGFVGAVARYALGRLVVRLVPGPLPVGTLAVNALGCLLLGITLAFLDARPGISSELRLALVFGLLGSFTTFSAFGFETLELLRAGAAGLALANVLLSILGSVAGVWLGRTAGAAFIA